MIVRNPPEVPSCGETGLAIGDRISAAIRIAAFERSRGDESHRADPKRRGAPLRGT